MINCKLLSASQPFGWAKINVLRRRKKVQNKDRIKEGEKEIVLYDKNESKYADKLLTQLRE